MASEVNNSDADPSDASRATAGSTVLFLGRDIFFAPVVKTAATAAGFQFTMLPRLDSQIAPEKLANTRACVVDLTPLSEADIEQLGSELARTIPQAQRIAFGPHVNVDLFQAASQAGFSPVLAKGQVAGSLARILRGD